jgi:hypothetical protein
MRTRRHRAKLIDDLRLAIDCLPLKTRLAMLEGVKANDRIIVGAYTDQQGGVCPMLAAHRHGGRTDFLCFAKSWDRFTRATLTRTATERELRILIDSLQASITGEVGVELSDVIADHRRLLAARERSRSADAQGEIVIRRKSSGGWLRQQRGLARVG